MYAIVVDYHMWNEEEQKEFTKPMYLGMMYPPINIYVFDEEFNSRSYRWSNKEEAKEYFVKHEFGKQACCYENARIEEVEIHQVVNKI